jgi:acetyltransferase-like isoleucine patch superfamily enzyme
MSLKRRFLDWLRANLTEEKILYSRGSLNKRSQITFIFKCWFSDALIVLKQVAISMLFWPMDLIRFFYQLQVLHFAPMRKTQRGKGCVVDCQTWIVNGQNVELGNYVKISSFSTLMAGANSKVKIGAFTIIGPGTLIVSFNHGRQIPGLPFRYQPWEDSEANTIVIGENVWIGGNVIVLPGAVIERNSVIGAGSVVKGTVREGSLYIGSHHRMTGGSSAVNSQELLSEIGNHE